MIIKCKISSKLFLKILNAHSILSRKSWSLALNTEIDFFTIVAACNCPTDSTVKMYLSFFFP